MFLKNIKKNMIPPGATVGSFIMTNENKFYSILDQVENSVSVTTEW